MISPSIGMSIAATGFLIVGVALTILAISRLPFRSFPGIRTWLRRRDERRDDLWRARDLARQQRELEPHLVAFDSFYPAAKTVLELFSKLRDSKAATDEEWQTFEAAVSRAVLNAGRLVNEGNRNYSLNRLAPFASVDHARAGNYSAAARELEACLYELNRYYSFQRQSVGLPEPRSQHDAFLRRDEEDRRRRLAEYRAWDEFDRAASGLLAAFYDLRDTGDKPDNWQEILGERYRAALTAAHGLDSRRRPDAEKRILPFANAASGDQPLDDFSVAAADLQKGLSKPPPSRRS